VFGPDALGIPVVDVRAAVQRWPRVSLATVVALQAAGGGRQQKERDEDGHWPVVATLDGFTATALKNV
jgi:hypothetical protein